jgi:hypothetical protein
VSNWLLFMELTNGGERERERERERSRGGRAEADEDGRVGAAAGGAAEQER